MSIGIGTSTTSGNVGIGTSKQPTSNSFSSSGNVGIGTSTRSNVGIGTSTTSGTVGSSGSSGSSGMSWWKKLINKLDKDK